MHVQQQQQPQHLQQEHNQQLQQQQDQQQQQNQHQKQQQKQHYHPKQPSPIFHQPLEKPIVILNSDLQTNTNGREKQRSKIVDNTDVLLLESLNQKIERLATMEGILNQQISQKISQSNSKEVLIGQIRDQRTKLDEIVRLQTIRIEELLSQSTRASTNLNTTSQIMNDTEKEVSNLKFVLAEKENVVKQWSARGADIERINSDINLLRSQLGQLQTDNQILRNNIQLDPEYNYIII